ncbi:SRPBCC family protein [Tropicimonas sp. IMCC6043]|uniref:SRPBCC family protein n=1 Tax=Tropicimonas sp. IMCC6043 TaxID=2510645 RepID=UPI00101D073A|nr:SRPBCC family protein [Tropicimonas sp. IMCC6043]RYH09727.1 SRPBCC family protein [Tropicimonas sp. IMCC6043]
MFARYLLAVAGVAIAVPALAVQVTREVEVHAAAAEVWKSIGSFCAIGDWYPGIASCTETVKDGATYRKLVTSDGAEFLEKYVETYSDMAYGYAIIESPLPVKNYEATLKVKDLGETSLVEWTGTFEADGAPEKDVVETVGDIFQVGLDALKVQFATTH